MYVTTRIVLIIIFRGTIALCHVGRFVRKRVLRARFRKIIEPSLSEKNIKCTMTELMQTNPTVMTRVCGCHMAQAGSRNSLRTVVSDWVTSRITSLCRGIQVSWRRLRWWFTSELCNLVKDSEQNPYVVRLSDLERRYTIWASSPAPPSGDRSCPSDRPSSTSTGSSPPGIRVSVPTPLDTTRENSSKPSPERRHRKYRWSLPLNIKCTSDPALSGPLGNWSSWPLSMKPSSNVDPRDELLSHHSYHPPMWNDKPHPVSTKTWR